MVKISAKQKKGLRAAVFILSIFVPLLCMVFELDNDTYWIIKTGEEICKNGIPAKDFLTIHTDMDLVVQQWLSDVIFYKIYSVCGLTAVVLFKGVIYIIYALLIYKLCRIISNRKFIIPLFLLLVNVVMIRIFFVARPQIFSYCIILCELIALESYVKTGKIRRLFILPALSVLEVNLHASMWTMLFIIMLPYLANALPIKIKGKSIACCKILPLIISAAAMGVCGLVSPYGYKGLAFIFTTSIGNKVGSWIGELSPLYLNSDSTDLVLLASMALVLIFYLFHKSGKTQIRYVLLTAGTALMMLKYTKLSPYFLISAYPVLLAYIDNLDFKKLKPKFKGRKNKKGKKNMSKKLKIAATAFIVIFAAGAICMLAYDNIADTRDYIASGGKDETITDIDNAVAAMERDAENNGKELTFFNSFNSGGYLEFLGYKTYIDPRADSFVKEANHDFDYLTEYRNVSTCKVYHQKVFDKYGFNYAIYEYEVSPALYTAMTNDSNCKEIYKGTDMVVFAIGK